MAKEEHPKQSQPEQAAETMQDEIKKQSVESCSGSVLPEDSQSVENDATSQKQTSPGAAKKRHFSYKWLFAAITLIIIFFFVFFDSIRWFYLNVEVYAKRNNNSIYFIGVLAALLTGWLVWYVPKRQVKALKDIPLAAEETKFEREKERLKLEDDKRKTMAQIVGGAFLLFGLFFTYNSFVLNREGQITDRFSKAIDHLGNKDLSARLGGLYALERILNDSEKDHWTIIEILSAYVREKAKKGSTNKDPINKESKQSAEEPLPITPTSEASPSLTPKEFAQIATDIQAALTIIGRRPKAQSWFDEIEEIDSSSSRTKPFSTRIEDVIDLRNLNLSGVNLYNANLTGTYFSDSDLRDSNFIQADFRWAYLDNVNLSNSRFTLANFYRAELRDVNLEAADLSGAILEKASITSESFSAYTLEKASFRNIFIDGKLFQTKEAALQHLREIETQKVKE